MRKIITKHYGSYNKRGRPPKDYKPPIKPILKIKREKVILNFD